MTNEEYNKEVGKRVKAVRERYGLSQMDILRDFGSKTALAEEGPDKKANHISMIEHGKRSLTEKNLRILSEKYHVQPGYLRLETEYMTEAEELQAGNAKFLSLQDMRKTYFQMMMTSYGYTVSYETGGRALFDKEGNTIKLRSGDCFISDKSGQGVLMDYDRRLELVHEFEDHFVFQIQRMIDKKVENQRIEALNHTLLYFGEGK